DRVADGLETAEVAINLGIEMNDGGAQVVEEFRLAGVIDRCEHRNVQLESGEILAHQLHHKRIGRDDSGRPDIDKPLETLQQLTTAFFGVFLVAQTGGIHDVNETNAVLRGL